ncbi:EscU/YscU/HrcU family type III secretion system export apparatus switch protein [Azohydromonas lata]|uniref:EscU/YscU/HrcU family type III secretion system export apparatus switch protein n=1 Tax=Azohydromonas lata TaxID=45677 RepID=A0ABU5IC11_9BURK|nr:EscU/YscU/HrcU family type III secretion system export apparatus switch protein [Azohydromonas lata]MDZ5456080.1 EscU/YscU/HrcU family type III secretion system export apparatus switch protein [Azohydromonas lata]
MTHDAQDDLARRRAAVALTYDTMSQVGAPKVVAKGYNQTAEKIMELAREAGIPITESAELARALMHVKLDKEIPTELYAAVAEILAWVWRLGGKGKK